ncbi:MAG: hypothetical protein GX605_14130, partial [Chloroflexi bacterium]|nr:hypothetical protein [Chloroflexota bacterium]
MSRLWLRLFLAFGVVALIAVGSVALLVNWSSQNLFETYVHQSLRARGEAVAPVLEQYYATYGAWQGVDALLEGLAGVGRGAPGMMMGRGRGMMGGSALSGVAGGRWLLADGNGQVLADTAGPVSGGGLSAAQQERAISLEVNGQRVGWLVPQITLSEQASLEAQYLQAVNRATLWAGGAAALAAMLL